MTNIFDNVGSVTHDNKIVASIVTGDSGVIYEASYVEFTFTGTTLTQHSNGSFSGTDMVIDYGDGTVEATTGKFGHTYAQNGTYTIKIYNVTSLGNYCFSRCTGLTSINIPNSVTSLGYYCFENCTGLTSINIPNSITSLKSGCFAECSGLTSINIPNSVTSFGDGCFFECINLTSINISNNVTSIGEYCFRGCTGLTSINVPNSVTSLGSYCFRSCTNLTSVILNWTTSNQIITYNSNWITNANANLKFIIPEGTTDLYLAKEYPSNKLPESSVKLTFTGTTLTHYGSFDGTNMIVDYGDGTVETTTGKLSHTYSQNGSYAVKIYGVTKLKASCFNGCTGLTSIILSNNVTSIGGMCFWDCTNLTNIIIPDSVTAIGTACFNRCSKLTEIILAWDTSSEILTYNSNWIAGANSNLKFEIPAGTKSLYIAKGYPSNKLDDGTIISSVNLNATKTTLSKSHNDTTTLTATVIDSNNQSVSGETVQIYNGNTLIGTMTESNGTYSYTYTSQGSGDLSLTAKCSNISSNSINIEDCFYYKSEESTTVPIQCSCTPNCIAQYEIYPVNIWNWHYINVSNGTNSQSVATLSTSYHNNSSASIKTTYFPPQNRWTPMEFKIQNNVATITSNGTNKGSTNITIPNINTLVISNSYTNTKLRNVKIKPL